MSLICALDKLATGIPLGIRYNRQMARSGMTS